MGTLYTPEILRMALALADFPPLDAATVRIDKAARPCGSRIVLDVRLDARGNVVAAGASIGACAFGQASGAIMLRHIGGRCAQDLSAALAAIVAWLASDEARAPVPDWPELGLLAPARQHSARHNAILLPFVAAAEALTEQNRGSAPRRGVMA